MKLCHREAKVKRIYISFLGEHGIAGRGKPNYRQAHGTHSSCDREYVQEDKDH